MSPDSLKRFYDWRYAGEAGSTGGKVCQYRRCPTSAIEAAVHYLPRYFRGGHILELGAGDGTLARSLIATGVRFDSYTVTELSEPRLEGLRRAFDDHRVAIKKLDAEALPDEELGRYDAVLMLAVIEHLVDPIGAMKRIKLLLKRDGFVYLDTPNIAKYSRRLRLLFGRFPATSASNEGIGDQGDTGVALFDEGHLHYFSHRSLTLMLTRLCGFGRVRWLPYHCGRNLLGRRLLHRLARWWPALLSDVAMIAYL